MKDTVAIKSPSEIGALTIKQAVIGLEFGQTDEKILAYSQYITHNIPTAAAHFVHVVPAPQLLESFYEDLASRYDIKASILQNLDKKINLHFQGQQLIPTYEAREGHPLKELLEVVEEQEADLVIIGQKAKPQEHGIMAKNLARQVKGNALVVPEGAPNKISKILVPIDFSPNSVKAFQTALALQQQMKEKAQIVCLNVYDLPNFSSYDVGRNPDQFRQWVVESRKEAFQNFLSAYAPKDQHDIPTVLVERKRPGLAHYILQYAKQEEFDLIVMGAKGHSTLERLLMGSVTERILTQNETLATLVVK